MFFSLLSTIRHYTGSHFRRKERDKEIKKKSKTRKKKKTETVIILTVTHWGKVLNDDDRFNAIPTNC